MTLTLDIDLPKQKTLEMIAKDRGKDVSEVISELIDDFLRNQSEERKIEELTNKNLMDLSESSFTEWDNEEDAIYDDL